MGTELSQMCLLGEHSICAHWRGGSVNVLKGRSDDLLCTCECHRGCPLVGKSAVPRGAWAARCVCAAAAPLKETFGAIQRESKVRKAALAESVEQAKLQAERGESFEAALSAELSDRDVEVSPEATRLASDLHRAGRRRHPVRDVLSTVALGRWATGLGKRMRDIAADGRVGSDAPDEPDGPAEQ